MSSPSPALLTSNPIVAGTPPASAASPRSPKPPAALPYRVVVDCDARRNCLVVPGLLGDPFTCFDADERAGYLVTGTAIGSVCLWRLDHVAAVMLDMDPAAVAAVVDGEEDSEEVVARVLTTSSDEGVKQIFIKDQQIFALIGDVHVKIWGSWHDPSSQMKKFDRVHEYKSCKEAYTLLGGTNNSKVLVVTVGASEGVRLDLDSMAQSPCTIRIPSHSTPCAYDGRELLILQVLQSGCKVLLLWRTEGGDKLMHSLVFAKISTFYWGFQTLDRPAPEQALAAAGTGAGAEQKENGSSAVAAASASAVPVASAAAAAPSSTRYLAYVSHFVSVKLIPYSALPGPLEDVSDLVPTSAETRSHGASGRASHRILAASRSGTRILAYLVDGARGLVLTLGSDNKLKIFALDARAAREAGMDSAALRSAGVKDDDKGSSSSSAAWSPGKSPSPGILVRKYRGLLGTFKLGYPYILKRIGQRLLLYSADEGIFILRL